MLLNTHTFYSHSYGTLGVQQLIAECANMGFGTVALTDINNTCAMLDFVYYCQEAGIRPVAGIDFRNMAENAAQLYIGIAKNNEGFRELNIFLSHHLHTKTPFPKRPPVFKNAFIIYPFNPALLPALRENEFMGILPEDLNRLIKVPAQLLKKKALALCPVSFKDKEDYYLHCLLRAVGCNLLLSKLSPQQAGRRTECLQSPLQMQETYKQHPYLLVNTQKLLEQCHIQFSFGDEKNKRTFTGSANEDYCLLRDKCYEGLQNRYGANNREAVARLEKELNVVVQKNFVAYFLTAWDIVQYAKCKGYFHAGRGSGANSIAAYCLGITEVDPIALDLYFERFLNMHRNSPPDFDIDFSWKDREDVTQYIFDKYGLTYTALLGSHNTFQFRAAVHELGKVYGLPRHETEALGDAMELERRTKSGKKASQTDIYKEKILRYGARLTKFPHYLSVHASGLVVSQQPLHFYTATELPPKGFPITHFDMYTADRFKLHKLDILSQRGLGHIKDCIKIVKENRGEDIEINRVGEFIKDKKLNALLAEGDTIGCFYIESPAMRQLLKKLRCEDFLTLVAASSIIRPGVADSGMLRMYIKYARQPETYKPLHPVIGKILGETYGVMVYQEDIIRVAHEFAGISLNNADVLRRAMAWKFRQDDGFERLKSEFFTNCRERSYPEAVTSEVWRQMEGFAGFSFCKAHSASYAVESYQSLYLRAYYPLEFMVAVVNNFGGFYDTEFYLNEARRQGATIHAPCINTSGQLTTIQGTTIYLGFIHIKSLQEAFVQRILAEREENGLYLGLADFYERLKPGPEQLMLLVRAGAFAFSGNTKRQMLWEACLLGSYSKSLPPTKSLFAVEPVKTFSIPRLEQSYREDALQEIELLGFPLCSRFDLLTTAYRGDTMVKEMGRKAGKKVKMTGYLFNTKTKKTVKGSYMQFGSFLDEEGHTFETVLFPPVYQEYPLTSRGIYMVAGKVTEDYGVFTLELSSWERMQVSFDPEKNMEAIDPTAFKISSATLKEGLTA